MRRKATPQGRQELPSRFLIEEVIRTLVDPTADVVANELAELGLLELCRPALPRAGAGSESIAPLNDPTTDP